MDPPNELENTLTTDSRSNQKRKQSRKTSQNNNNKLSQLSNNSSKSDDILMDIMDDTLCKSKVGEKRSSAQSHFDFFLTLRNTQLQSEGKDIGKTSYEDITFEDLNSGSYIGEYANYLAQVARLYRNVNNELISYGSAVGYMGAIKNYFLDKFSKVGIPLQLQEEQWKRKIARVRSMKRQQASKNKKPVVVSKEAASDEDRTGIAAICIWSGNVVNAEFMNFFQSMVMNCGRGSEIGIATFDDLHLRHIEEESGMTYKTLEQYVNWSKTEGKKYFMNEKTFYKW